MAAASELATPRESPELQLPHARGDSPRLLPRQGWSRPASFRRPSRLDGRGGWVVPRAATAESSRAQTVCNWESSGRLPRRLSVCLKGGGKGCV